MCGNGEVSASEADPDVKHSFGLDADVVVRLDADLSGSSGQDSSRQLSQRTIGTFADRVVCSGDRGLRKLDGNVLPVQVVRTVATVAARR